MQQVQDSIPGATALVCGVLIWIPLTVWILSMIQWMIAGELDGLTGFLGTAAGIILGMTTLKPPAPILSPVLCVLTYLTVLAFPMARDMFNKAQLVSIELEILDNAYTNLKLKPDNVGLRLKVAKLLYGRGLAGSAIMLAESTLKHLPPGPFDAEAKMLHDWKLANGNVSAYRSLPCLECGFTNGAGEIMCKRCGAPFLLHHAQGRWIGPDLGRKVISGFSALIMASLGTPLIFTHLTGGPQVISFGFLWIAVFCLILRALLPTKRRRLT